MGEREVAKALLESARIQLRQLIVSDKGFASREFEAFVRGLGATLVRPDGRDEGSPLGIAELDLPAHRVSQ